MTLRTSLCFGIHSNVEIRLLDVSFSILNVLFILKIIHMYYFYTMLKNLIYDILDCLGLWYNKFFNLYYLHYKILLQQ